MNPNRRWHTLWGLFIVVMIIFPLFVIHSEAQTQPVFRVGVIDSEFGSLHSGAKLAVEEINATGGVRGADGTLFHLELVVQPDSNVERSLSNINQARVIAIIGPSNPNVLTNNLSTFQGLNVPILTTATGDILLIQDTTGRTSRIRSQDIIQQRALADYLITQAEVNNIVTVVLEDSLLSQSFGFASALANLGQTVERSFNLGSQTEIEELAEQIVESNPEATVVYGSPEQASELYLSLRDNDWNGTFAYQNANSSDFRSPIPLESLFNLIHFNSWSYDLGTTRSDKFVNNYVDLFGMIPDAEAVAAYDGIYLLAEAITRPGTLQTNLGDITDLPGAQGTLDPGNLPRGETSANVAISHLLNYGTAPVALHYENGVLSSNNKSLSIATSTPSPSPTPSPTNTPAFTPTPTVPPATATPEGVTASTASGAQNVRTGPGLVYDVIGQAQSSEEFNVIGVGTDDIGRTWVVVNFRGRQGWMAEFLLEVTGDLQTVPRFASPPTPTPVPPTNTPTPVPIADIVVVSASPNLITLGVPTNIGVVVQNQGSIASGAFGIATTFQPDGVYQGVTTTAGLAPGQSVTIQLPVTLNQATGPQTITIVADLNDQVSEGPEGEANNETFQFTYMVDRPLLNRGTLNINPGGTLTLEGTGNIDLQWTGTSLDALNNARMYIITGVSDISEIHYGMIDPALANTTSLNVGLLPNTFIGMITAEGNRAAIHIDSVTSGGAITITYQVYQP